MKNKMTLVTFGDGEILGVATTKALAIKYLKEMMEMPTREIEDHFSFEKIDILN